MKSISTILEQTKDLKRPKNLSTEFQHYGVYIADILGDAKHYSLYIKLCKDLDRVIINQALNFAKDCEGARSKARISMWKLKQLRDLAKERAA